MNCIDVRRKLTTTPSIQDEMILAHLEHCTACANFAVSMNEFDQTLHTATNIDIPDGLAERILLKQSFTQQHQQRATRFKFYAMAASLLIIVTVSLNMNNLNSVLNNTLSLEDVAINHVNDERHHLNDRENIQLAKLNNVLQPFNIAFKDKIGQVNYVGTCPIRNSRGVHIVLQKENETATLLVMPGEYVTNRTSRTKGDFKTVIIPTQNGSIAIVTLKNSQADFEKNIESKLNQAIQYI